MVRLEEVMDEEFVREQEGPHDEDDWDTDSGMQPHPSSISSLDFKNAKMKHRVRHIFHRLRADRRNPLRAYPRPTRHNSRLHTALYPIKSLNNELMAQIRIVHGRQDPLGSEHECAFVGRAVGIGV